MACDASPVALFYFIERLLYLCFKLFTLLFCVVIVHFVFFNSPLLSYRQKNVCISCYVSDLQQHRSACVTFFKCVSRPHATQPRCSKFSLTCFMLDQMSWICIYQYLYSETSNSTQWKYESEGATDYLLPTAQPTKQPTKWIMF